MSLLELREADAATTQGNGDWSCQLAEPVTISDGDTLVMRQCFLDTRNQAAGKITLEDDLQCIVAGGLYLQDWLPTGVSTGVFEVPGPMPTNQEYVLCSEHPGGTLSGVLYYKSQKFEMIVYDKGFWGNLTIGYQYSDINGYPTYVQVYLPKLSTEIETFELPLNFIASTSAPVTIQNPSSEFNKANTTIRGYTTEAVTKDTFTHVKRSMTFVIPKGIYEPTDLATRISNILSTNTQTVFATVPVASPWLVALSDFQSGGSSQPLVNYDCTNIVTYPSTSNYYVGASQMSLIWDDATQRFGFSYLHTPLYDGAGDIVTSFIKREQNLIPTGDSVVCTRNGGVFLTALLPASFWFGTLQLKPTIISQLIFQDISIGTYVGQADRILGGLVPGLNSTTAFVGIDAAIEKSADFYKVPTIPNPPAMLNNIAQNTTEIWGEEIQDTSSSSHYLLDVTGCGRTSVIGKQSRCEIRGVIGSYYSQGGFTQGDSSGAISYTHEGEPFQIQGLNVRVLLPDGTSASGVLGNQSCLFLELIKASPQPPPVKK